MTATGLRKERDGERGGRRGRRNSFYTSSRWINTICVVPVFEILASLLLAQLAGSRTLHLTADNEAIWPSKEEDGVERPALVVAICQSVDLKRATGCLKSI